MTADNERPGGRGQERVPVRIRPGYGLGTEVLSRPGPVLDDHGDAPFRRQLLSDDPGDDVQQRSRRNGDDDLDRAMGKVLGRGLDYGSSRTNSRHEASRD